MKKSLCLLLVCLLLVSLLLAGCKKEPAPAPSEEQTTAAPVNPDQPTDPSGSNAGDEKQELFSVLVTIKGNGQIAWTDNSTKLVFNDEDPLREITLTVEGKAEYLFAAKPDEGAKFVKWVLNGADFSTDSVVTVPLTGESTLIAVFEDE